MRVYAKVWFIIKKNWQFYHSSFHVWETIRESRFLPKKLREAAVDPCIQANAFAMHPKNLLMTMLVDYRQEIRRQAVDIKCLHNPLPSGTHIPSLLVTNYTCVKLVLPFLRDQGSFLLVP